MPKTLGPPCGIFAGTQTSLKKMLKDKQISEDNERDGLEEMQKLTNTYIGKVDELSKSKEHEIMGV